MKVVILAGGLGTRISEESHLKPKPMIEIGDKPILWHIMKIYSSYGFNDFIICLGYKGYCIKEYFANYMLHNSNITFDFRHGSRNPVIHNHDAESWKVTLIDTGLDTMTGGRVSKIKNYLEGKPFMLTYGDGLSDVNLQNLLEFHKKHGKIATITSVQPVGRYGAVDMTPDGQVEGFREKPEGESGWINAGFFVLQPEVFDFLGGDDCILERQPMEKLASEGQLYSYQHEGFWHAMDTLRDKIHLDTLWKTQSAPWKIWDDNKPEKTNSKVIGI